MDSEPEKKQQHKQETEDNDDFFRKLSKELETSSSPYFTHFSFQEFLQAKEENANTLLITLDKKILELLNEIEKNTGSKTNEVISKGIS